MTARRFGCALGVVAALAAAASAEPDPDATARDLVQRAQRHFDLAEYPEAIAGFREAYRADPRPGLLYNLAQAYRLEGDCATAAFMYRRYLRKAPDSKYRPLAEQQLAAIAACEQAQLDAGARPTPIDEPAADLGQPLPELVVPAPIAIAVATAPTAAAPGGGRLRLAGLATGAAGAVAIAAGAYFSWDAARASREVSDGYRDGATWADLDAIDARGRRAEVAGGALLAAGAVAIASGAALYVLGWRAGERAEVRPRGGGADVVVSWRF